MALWQIAVSPTTERKKNWRRETEREEGDNSFTLRTKRMWKSPRGTERQTEGSGRRGWRDSAVLRNSVHTDKHNIINKYSLCCVLVEGGVSGPTLFIV